MIFELEFTEEALADLNRLKKAGDKKLLKKLFNLLLELREHPLTGTGKIERLKYYNEETWSRRLSAEHRLVYRIYDTRVVVLVLSAFGHY
ncbi:MAG TPA: Txe/YoeB family addiction module toxin [Bacteroidales bacterium]|nr:Txe/YoeB family addiction module toxin [Bacteroidales bacterium]